jgi:Glycosyltransferases, probably involved in cell wall biogenesis
MHLGIVIPAFRPDIERLAAYVRALKDRLSPVTIRIEIDEPLPETVDQLTDIPAEVSAVAHRRGKGRAITQGFERLDTDVLAFADADGSTTPESLDRVIEPVTAGEVDLSVGSRRHPDARVRGHQTLGRRHLGDVFAWLARHLVEAQLYDYQCGAKALAHDTWKTVREQLREPGFAWDIELIALTAASGRRVIEVPVEWKDQPGTTVAPVRDGARMLRGLVVAHHRAEVKAGATVHRLLANSRRRPPAIIDQVGTEEY